ncbi:MocR-like pyridoxine biosynthesis transcription factor PdxR [Cohnella abietis]|uniref:Transcriptional regulator n=1 Tax=Cohnella abietis TaxID=2507935 RepID=A0A3T1DAN7_9BACL|nr:PLP-dependent aminotransferase family protein [Cohnella abietis]BBI35038.1 transcriptional regulator [Cohnella abietis]
MSSPFRYSKKLAECGSKHLALYLAIREAITEGNLPSGEKLPSTRNLATLYGLSRGSVSVAYEMLAAEGFVQTGVGQGTFVAGWDDDEMMMPSSPNVEQLSVAPAAPILSTWGRRLLDLQPSYQSTNQKAIVSLNKTNQDSDNAALQQDADVSFVPEGVGTAWFPWMEWKAEVAQHWKSIGSAWQKSDYPTEGSLSLRQSIASRLRSERGIVCDAEDIVVTSGSMQAIALLTQLLLEKGKTAVIENPSYTGIQRAVNITGAKVIAEEVDSSGIIPRDWDAQLLFVTPTRQFPTGAVLSYERRRALLSWASRRNAWIIEDDYDSDFRWGGRPIEPLKALDREGRVVYVGTFSRSMSVGVRIGYAVIPRELISPFIMAKQLYDPYPAGIAEQQALAGWMAEGGFDRYMRRMRRVFGKLEGKLRQAINYYLEGLFEVLPSDAGLHVYVRWNKSSEDYMMLVQECAKSGVTWWDGAIYVVQPSESSVPSALFGFTHLNEDLIDKGIRKIRQAAQSIGLIDSDQMKGESVQCLI